MDVKNKQKPKKRRTRRNLDDLRKRSCREVKNVNPISKNTIKFKNIPKYNNELMTCKRLTLSLFTKAVRSKTVTRLPFTRIDNTSNVNRMEMSNILTMSSQSQNPINDASIICENNIALKSPTVNQLFKNHVCGIVNSKNDPTSCSPSNNGLINLDNSTEEDNYKCEYLNNITSDPNSEVESSHCYYEKFMNDLPAYLEEHFPALTRNFLNENLAYLKQNYSENSCQQKESDSLDYNDLTVNIPQNHRGSIIQNAMHYFQTGLSWEQSVNNSSPSVSEFDSNTSDIFLNSPDYQYFPHKLNQ